MLDLPGGPGAKHPPANAGDTGLIPGLGTKIPHVMGQLSPCATTESSCHLLQLEKAHAQQQRAMRTAMRSQRCQKKIKILKRGNKPIRMAQVKILKNKECYKRERMLHNDQGINQKRRNNNCKYI